MEETKKRPRRTFTEEFKKQMVYNEPIKPHNKRRRIKV